MRLILFITCLIFCSQSVIAETTSLNLNVRHAQLPDVLRVLADALHMNVLLSPAVQGEVSTGFQSASPRQAFNMLLKTHDLAIWREGEIWYIAPRRELQQQQQAAEEIATEVWPIYYAKADQIAKFIASGQNALLSARGRIQIDTRTNSICVQDTLEQLKRLHRIIQAIDVPVQQIAITARLVSVDNTVERELGLDFTVTTDLTKSITNNYSLALVKLANGSDLDVKLAALENAGHAELISKPSLFTANQQTASIEAGEEVPYQETSESGGTAIVFKKAVLGLKVTPQVLPGKKVLLHLQINQDRPSTKMVLGMPTISTRQIVTSILVRSGQTIVLGGIYETNMETDEKRVPFLYRLPMIGWLFKQQSVRKNKRELLIFVTPKIIV